MLIGFLELINNMLTTGIVPALFADEEREGIIGNVSRLFVILNHMLIIID